MHRNEVELVTDFTPGEIGGLFSARNLDYAAFFDCYSSRNAKSVNTCVDNCFEGVWWAVAFRFMGHFVAQHHAADRSREHGYAWTSGYWAPEWRGVLWHALQRKVWTLARMYFETAFPHLFCVAYCHNPWADVWIRERCDFTKAAKMREGVVAHDGQRKDIWLYAQKEEDVGMCIEVAQCVFEGHGGIERV